MYNYILYNNKKEQIDLFSMTKKNSCQKPSWMQKSSYTNKALWQSTAVKYICTYYEQWTILSVCIFMRDIYNEQNVYNNLVFGYIILTFVLPSLLILLIILLQTS